MKRPFPVFALIALAACNIYKHELMETCITQRRRDVSRSRVAGQALPALPQEVAGGDPPPANHAIRVAGGHFEIGLTV